MAVEQYDMDIMFVRQDDTFLIDHATLRGLWTEAQYLAITDHSNRLIEFTDGVIEVQAMPTREHQRISAFLYRMLFALMERIGGIVLYAPLRVQTRTGAFREPDLVVLMDEHDPRNQNAYWLGADLVVEIVSPDRPERDLVDKRQDYAEAGIPEYWIVNPLDRTITVLTLKDVQYATHGVFALGEQMTSKLLPSVALDTEQVFATT